MAARGELETYRKKRDFSATPEPAGQKATRRKGKARYLIQRHAATRLHYDFRIEHDGVLKSWAVTKAPSRDPAVKRLAVEVEDHPLDYGAFEGAIPPGNYGAGTVQLWDTGWWEPQDPDLERAFASGQLKMVLHGQRLAGKWALIRLKSDRGRASKRDNWLLIKEKDEHAVSGEGDANMEIDASVTTGRTLAEIAEGSSSWTASKPTTRKAPPKPKAPPTVGRPPGFVPLQLCKVADLPPSGAGWVHEIKFDGYRMQMSVGGGRAILRTRTGLDWSDRFPEIVGDAARWPDGVVDGELCAVDAEGRPDFSALVAAYGDGRTQNLVYFAFDLLFEGAEDLRALPLGHRKARLQAYIDRVPGTAARGIRFVEHFATTGQAVLDSACRMDLEGVISKRLDAPYQAGRTAAWLKSKCRGRDEVVIGGWTSEGGTRFRSLIVGVQDGEGLRSLGRVGTGFGQAVAKTLVPALKAQAADRSPFTGPGAPKGGRDIHWVKPVLVAEIEHGGYTESGALRQAAFKGLRQDKPAPEVVERPQAPARAKGGKAVVAGVTLSNPDKVLWPGDGERPPVTKADLARYYALVAPRLLPHVADRPTSIIRAPDGIEGERFFQRHAMPGSNPRLKLIDVRERKPYVAVADVGGLAAIAQSGGLELHPWGCRPDDPETPEQITFDLDPDEGLDFAAVIDAALSLRTRLESLGLKPFCKTTGGKGLHVVTPVKSDVRSRVDWDTLKAFSKAVCEVVRADQPDRFTTTLAKKARGGKIFLDYLRNGRMATAVAPWSPRARPGATIAFPLAWDEVRPGLNPRDYTMHEAAALLARPDPWAEFQASAVSLKPILKRALG